MINTASVDVFLRHRHDLCKLSVGFPWTVFPWNIISLRVWCYLLKVWLTTFEVFHSNLVQKGDLSSVKGQHLSNVILCQVKSRGFNIKGKRRLFWEGLRINHVSAGPCSQPLNGHSLKTLERCKTAFSARREDTCTHSVFFPPADVCARTSWPPGIPRPHTGIKTAAARMISFFSTKHRSLSFLMCKGWNIQCKT